GVIVTPVRHSMPLTWNVASALGMEFERHDRSSRWQRRLSVPKLLKRPPRPYPCTKVPRRGDLAHPALRTDHSRHSSVQERAVLEEVEMPPRLVLRVVNRTTLASAL